MLALYFCTRSLALVLVLYGSCIMASRFVWSQKRTNGSFAKELYFWSYFLYFQIWDDTFFRTSLMCLTASLAGLCFYDNLRLHIFIFCQLKFILSFRSFCSVYIGLNFLFLFKLISATIYKCVPQLWFNFRYLIIFTSILSVYQQTVCVVVGQPIANYAMCPAAVIRSLLQSPNTNYII